MHAVNPDLERALIDDPDNAAACAVYADWLTERGDPRGELMGLELMRTRVRREARPDVDRRIAEILNGHRDYLLGDLAEHLEVLHLSWKHGFIRSAHLLEQAPEVLWCLLTHPSARMIQSLSVTDRDFGDDARTELVDVILAHAPRFRALALEISVTSHVVSQLASGNWPELVSLTLDCDRDEPHDSPGIVTLVERAPKLRELILLDCDHAKALVAQPPRPRLRIELERTAPRAPSSERENVDVLDIGPALNEVELDDNGVPLERSYEAWSEYEEYDSDEGYPTAEELGVTIEEYRDDPLEDAGTTVEPYREDDPDAEVDF